MRSAFFVSSTGNLNTTTWDRVKMNIAFDGDTGHFDNEIDLVGPKGLNAGKSTTARIIVFVSSVGSHLSFEMPCSFVDQVLPLIC